MLWIHSYGGKEEIECLYVTILFLLPNQKSHFSLNEELVRE